MAEAKKIISKINQMNTIAQQALSQDFLPRELWIYLAGVITPFIVWVTLWVVKGFFGKVRR